MPITEVPPSPPSAPPEPPRLRRLNRYDDYEVHDLLNVIEELEGSRNWASLREKIWIALIIHLVIFWYLAYGPKYLFNVKVVDPSVVLKQREKDMTYLDLPPDALKLVKPRPAPLSDKNRTTESHKPTLDKKTLDQLEAMRRATPPAPQPSPSQAPPAPQIAQAPPQPQPPAQPLPMNQQSQVEAPRPAPTRPSFDTGHSTVGQELQQLARQARGGGQSAGPGANAPTQHPGLQGGAQILSDTMGVDFNPYLQRIVYDTERSWYPIIPEAAQPPLLKQGRVMIRFHILRDGSVKSMTLELPSGDVSLDRAAWGGITGASPYPPLPKEFKGQDIELRFMFLYNIPPGQQ